MNVLRAAFLAILASFAACAALASSANGYIYWTNYGNAGSGTTMGRADLGGNQVNQSFITGLSNPFGLATAGSRLYVTNPLSSALAFHNLDGSGTNGSLPGSHANYAITAGNGYLYWTDYAGGAIYRMRDDGVGTPSPIVTGISGPSAVAVDDQHVYWTSFSASTIGRANLDGTGKNGSFITGLSSPFSIAVDASHIYWGSSGVLGRATLAGVKDPSNFVTAPIYPRALQTDGAYLYYANDVSPTAGIGRVKLDGTGNQPLFIPGADNPEGLVVQRSDAMSVRCATASPLPGQSVTCTATVTDNDLATPTAPTGPVDFDATGSRGFSDFNECHLAPASSSSSSCSLQYIPDDAGSQVLTATYRGDRIHTPATATVTENVGYPTDLGVGKLKLNKRRGIAKLTVSLPGPGVASIKSKLLKRVGVETLDDPLTAKLPILPNAKGAAKLKRKGKLKVRADLKFTPPSGPGSVVHETLKLKLKR